MPFDQAGEEGVLDTLRWMRVIGDTVFATGILSLGWSLTGQDEPFLHEPPFQPV